MSTIVMWSTVAILWQGSGLLERSGAAYRRSRSPRPAERVRGLNSIEVGDTTEVYLFCFDRDGNLLQDDTDRPYKCEGVEIP